MPRGKRPSEGFERTTQAMSSDNLFDDSFAMNAKEDEKEEDSKDSPAADSAQRTENE